ncbi:hypothetical protein [Baekduia sp. Peel2402]|uniref:hypothetical protein n=1 Tax=Baekduia sp. Peel2402 TaxID=3458296 RepID=UPI00403E9588
MHIFATDWTAIAAIAQSVAAVGAVLVFGVAVLQRSDARDSAEAALRAAVAAERSVDVQSASQMEQFRLMTFPPVGCEFSRDGTTAYVRVSNPGDYPAIDVDLSLLQILWADDQELEEYSAQHVDDEHQEEAQAVGETDDGAYGVFDHIVYSSVPPRRSVKAHLGFATEPDSMVVLLQYRDIQGRNYQALIHAYWTSSAGRYTSYVVHEGNRVTEAPRLEMFGGTAPDRADASEDMRRELLDFWEHAFPMGWLKGPMPEIEDRGTWSDI